MTNRTRSLLIVAIVGIYLLFQFWPSSSEDSTEAGANSKPPPALKTKRSIISSVPREIKSKIPQIASPQIVIKTPTAALKPIPPVKAADGPRRPKPPESSVPYKVSNGWVTAYGDILLGKPKNPDFPPSGYIEAPKLVTWPQAIVPFSIHESLPNPERVVRVIAYMNQYSPVRFIPYSGQADNIVFFPMEGLCISYLGKVGGNQPIYLDSGCTEHEIIHELMHALGFIHEHSRADRDAYVGVQWNNIETERLDQFDISPEALNEPMKGRPFDYNSVMLYSSTAFARERGATTLVSLSPTQTIAPVGQGLSAEDLERLRLLYGR